MNNIKITPDLNVDSLLLCKDCQHYHFTLGMWWSNWGPRCKRESNQLIDLVSGKITNLDTSRLEKCSNERYYDNDSDYCGPKGIFWAPRKKTKENTFRLLKREQNV